MYGQSPDPTLRSEPNGTLGPRYSVVYVVPGPNGIRSRVVQHVYPYAKPSPLSHMSSGQSYWGSRKTLGGWFRGPVALKKVLVRAGLPTTAPPVSAGSSRAGLIGGIAGVFALVTLVAVARSARRRGWRPLRGMS
jgi:hypothetical protein